MSILLLCEVPLNKDTERERERERKSGNNSSSIELLIHITHIMKSICAEVAPVAFWVVSAFPKLNTVVLYS